MPSGAVADADPAAAPEEPARVAMIFSPWQGDIDLATKEGKTLWNEGTKALKDKFAAGGLSSKSFHQHDALELKQAVWLRDTAQTVAKTLCSCLRLWEKARWTTEANASP